MSFLAFVLAAVLVFTGALAAVAMPRLLFVHVVIATAWLSVEFPLLAVKFGGLAFLVVVVAWGGVRVAAAVLAEIARPQIPWSRAERLQRRVRRLSLDGAEEGFGQEWAAFAARRGFELAHTGRADRPNPAADPGNPGRLIATWTCPLLARRSPADGRYLLLMVDASPHRHHRRLGLFPGGAPPARYGLYGEIATDPDPLTAQASSWRVEPHVYAATRRAT
ncbi:hypothetical protein ACIB24_04225 [Spongisporangium articulatum]|uniref:Uncharacterized protein n=1 Tax=Spongisporangium articulatum TaxID=3362603 RepID=A0ABW8AIS6_9ACTN